MLEQRFDDQWRKNVSESWAQFHAQTVQSRTRLAELRNQGLPPEPAEELLLELADLEMRVGNGAEAGFTPPQSLIRTARPAEPAAERPAPAMDS